MLPMKALIAMTVAGLLLGSIALAGQDTSVGKSKPATVKKAQPRVKAGTKFVDVTGSNIKRRVEPGKRAEASTLNVTVMDPSSTENRGLTAMQMLSRNPTVTFSPSRGY